MWLFLGLLALSSVDAHGLDGCADVEEIRAEIAARLPSEVPVADVRVDVAHDPAGFLTVTTHVLHGAPRVRTLSFTDADCPVAARLVAQVVARQVEELAAQRLADKDAASASVDAHEQIVPAGAEDDDEHNDEESDEDNDEAEDGREDEQPDAQGNAPAAGVTAVTSARARESAGPVLQPALHLGGSLSLRGADPIATGGLRLAADMSLVRWDWLLLPSLGVVVDAAWPVPVGRGGGQLSTAALTLGLSSSYGAWSAATWLAAGAALATGVGFATPRASVLPWAAAGAVVSVDVASTAVGTLSLEVGIDVPLTQVSLAEQGSSSRVPGPLVRTFGGVALRFVDLQGGT